MADWPALPYDEWRETRETLHMYVQVIGKLRLALSPFEPEWGNVPFYLTARGLTTSPMPVGLRTLDAEFHRDVLSALGRLRVDVTFSPGPSEVPDPVPCAEDRRHHTYDPAQARRFWTVLSMVDVVLKEHHARFRGRTTPVHFFWGSFDLAVTRFSGRPASPPPGADVIMRFAEDAEQICAGWWPGDGRFPDAAVYSYAYPKPDGLEQAAVRPPGAAWNAGVGEFLLPYSAARTAPDPRAAILDFLTSTYEAAAGLMGWSGELTAVETPR